ncbi:hypothetical protein COV17_00610 [Candidatus Woesearchaeota archaeon CG10_big_fil_rev_8_21_14_0_10_36_11]|nr:MAG: hypothetical protein COV17_00610 [Candidatus Woesearchaeota archaeon CG10_big_fil_rev_8_21_14_0_10_36_11]
MDLRSLKKEVHSLDNIHETVQQFQDSWIKPLRSNTNSHLPFIQNISPEAKKELNKKLSTFYDIVYQTKKGQTVTEKLQQYTRYLIDLKLTEMQGDHIKARIITNNMLHDEFFNIQNTISEVKAFDTHTQKLSAQYNEINLLIHKELSLDETVFFMDLPHKKYLYNLLQIAKKQKSIVRQVGLHFVSLTRNNNLGK